MVEKRTFTNIFLMLSVVLMLLPFITTFNEFLTMIIMRLDFYTWIQSYIVPFESKIISVILNLFGIPSVPTATGVNIGRIQTIGNNMTISWNCIGWQSFILFCITLFTGFQGNYTWLSKTQTIIIGLSGTFLLNIFRIATVILFAQYLGKTYSIIFHDYFSTLITICWLFFFWWFAFRFVLTKKYEE